MAIWQFDFYIVPRDSLGNFDTENLWEGKNISTESLTEISKVLSLTQSWSKDITQYGENDDTCIQIFDMGNSNQSIRIRLGLYSLTRAVLESIVAFINRNKAVIILQNDMRVEPTMKNVIDLIKESNEFKYVKNPEEYLNSLG